MVIGITRKKTKMKATEDTEGKYSVLSVYSVAKNILYTKSAEISQRY